jgi:modified peptide precursor CbpA
MKGKKVIAFRRMCKGAVGAGLSHYIMLAKKEK